jgi:AcrR family transcriptional regulator
MESGNLCSASERRRRILEATERLLRRYGPSKTTVADIAREAEIAVGAVYLEFASKETIIEELSTAQHRGVLAAMRAVAAESERSFCDRLRAVFDTRAASFLELAEAGAHACDLVHCQSRAVKAAHDRFLDEERALVRDLLERGARAGELDVDEPELTARALLRAYASFSPPWLFASPRAEVETMLRTVHRLVLYGLACREPARPAR